MKVSVAGASLHVDVEVGGGSVASEQVRSWWGKALDRNICWPFKWPFKWLPMAAANIFPGWCSVGRRRVPDRGHAGWRSHVDHLEELDVLSQVFCLPAGYRPHFIWFFSTRAAQIQDLCLCNWNNKTTRLILLFLSFFFHHSKTLNSQFR